jgi:hypothetical protein
MKTTTAWPENVIARYLTVGGATVDLTQESDYFEVTVPTQTVAECVGCGERHVEEWGWNFWANERGEEQPDSYQRRGEYATPRARRWAQAHAETCRSMPRPTN